jgi:hypothetical protein
MRTVKSVMLIEYNIVVQDLFTVPHITEEDVLAFVETNRTVYSVEQKHGMMPSFFLH